MKLLLAAAAGLALADASIVALALPELLLEFDTSVEGVAAVLGVYVLVLALALLPAAALERRAGAARVGAAGLLLFTLASLACAGAGSLEVLLAARAVQALGGAAALIAAFTLIGADAGHRRLWVAAAVFGTAAGPALGGVLTQLFDWQAIFVAQAPIALVAAVAAARASTVPRPEAARSPFPLVPAAALALVSAALTAVLFLLVLELVAGFSVEPLVAAAAVTVLPVSALLASRVGGAALTRATAGALLLAGGTAALAFLPGASAWWTVPPQVLAGAGMGLALPALAGELLPERTAGDAARLLTVRHAGIVVVLVALAPLVSAQLDDAVRTAQLRGVALVLDAQLAPQDKLPLAPSLLQGVESDDPRGELEAALDEQRATFSGEDRAAYDELARRADETLVSAVGDAFDEAFLVTGGLALLAALLLALGAPLRAAVAAAALALLAVPAYAALREDRGPEPVVLADPCQERELPETGGLTGLAQDIALKQLDEAACRFGSTREELVLALADEDEAERYEEEHGTNPRSLGGIIDALIG